MDWKKLLAVPAALLMLLAVTGACKKEEEEEESGKSMSGVVEFSIPYYVLKGETVTMSATGIIDPTDVIYKWYVSGVFTDTLSTSVVSIQFPDSIGTFNVTATSYSNGYYTAAATQTVTTVDTSYNGSLQNVPRSGKSIIDPRDGRQYSYVTVGDLDWFSQNLAFYGYNGLYYSKAYKNSPSALGLFGAYYTWKEASINPCPEGWRVPDNSDWASLGSAMAGKPMPFIDDWAGLGEKASAPALFNEDRMWPYSPDNAHTNDFGWNALPLGTTDKAGKLYTGENEYGYWWSATEKNADQGYYRYIYYDRGDFPVGFASKEGMRAAVRCVRTHPQS